MKVSEAAAGIKADASTVWKDDNVCVVRRDHLEALLKSHEALRLAGEAVTGVPYNPSDIADLGTIVVSRNEYLALSRAVEDASK